MPFLNDCYAEARIYEPHDVQVNAYGAVSVRASDGGWLGVKPGEFEFVTDPAQPTPNYSTNLAPIYIAEQIFFYVMLNGGIRNPLHAISSKWFSELAAVKIRELLMPEPVDTRPPQPPNRSCNRHVDCEIAEKVRLEKHPGTNVPLSFHCHDEDCEDCFGQ